MTASRKTHIVRVTDPENSGQYADVEVLDAIAFDGPDGEMVFYCPAANADPLVIDNTGGGAGVPSLSPTRTSHMERLVNPADSTQYLDVEVIDRISFNATNGERWVLDMPGDAANTLVHGENEAIGSAATRSATLVKIPDPGDPNPGDPARYIGVGLPDAISFHTINGLRRVIVLDKNAQAATQPEGYIPGDDAHAPPENTDRNPYINWVGGGPWLGENTVLQGPLWWIRHVASGDEIGVLGFSVTWSARVPYPDDPTISGPFGSFSLLSMVKYPADGSKMWSPSPYITSSATPGPPSEIVDQATEFFQPEGHTGWPFSGVFTNSTVDGVGIPGAPYGSPGQAAYAYFTLYYPSGFFANMPGPGTVFSWDDLVALGIQTIPDPNKISHEGPPEYTSYVYTLAALVFFDISKLKSLLAPGATTFTFEIATGAASGSQFYDWSATFATYRSHAKAQFTYDSLNVPTWAFLPESSATVSSERDPEIGLPANTVTFDTDLSTLDVIGSKT